MKSQAFVPIVTNTNQILGQAPLDAPTTFVGDEEDVEIATITFPLVKVSYTRPTDMVYVEFMAIPFTSTQVNNGEHLSVPGYVAVEASTPDNDHLFNVVSRPNPDRSSLQTFLGSVEFES